MASRFLLEMNREVRGDSMEESPEHILSNKPDFFQSFTIVIATEMKEKCLKKLSQILWEANIPLMVVKAYGFVGYIRLQVKGTCLNYRQPQYSQNVNRKMAFSQLFFFCTQFLFLRSLSTQSLNLIRTI